MLPFSPPPLRFPAVLGDIGGSSAYPIVLVASGQSLAQGYDTGGSKAVLSDIYISNSITNPTAFVPAVFGSAPLNRGIAGTVTNAADAYNNPTVHFANFLRQSGLAKGRKIYILPNWYPGQSISNWDGVSSPYWLDLLAQLTLLNAQFPGCPISHIDWKQAEADSWSTNTGYNTEATYEAGLSRVIGQFKALPQWNNDASFARPTTMTLGELMAWGSAYPSTNRNDVLLTYRGGYRDPAIRVISAEGLTESVQNPGPHPNGASIVVQGQRAFEAYRDTRVGGNFGGRSELQLPNGSTDSFPNFIVGGTAGNPTLLGVRDLKTGALIVGNGGTISLPHPSNFAKRPITVRIFAQIATTLDFATTGGASGYDEAAGAAIGTKSLASPFIYEVQVVNAQWRVRSLFPLIGGLLRYTPTLTAGATTTISNVQCRYGYFASNNNTLTVTPFQGGSFIVSNAAAAAGPTTLTIAAANVSAGARFWEEDGTKTNTSITIPPGATVYIEIDTGFNLVVVSRSYPRLAHGTTAQRPVGLGAAERVAYFDDTLGKPIWWGGASWKDAAGATL